MPEASLRGLVSGGGLGGPHLQTQRMRDGFEVESVCKSNARVMGRKNMLEASLRGFQAENFHK